MSQIWQYKINILRNWYTKIFSNVLENILEDSENQSKNKFSKKIIYLGYSGFVDV